MANEVKWIKLAVDLFDNRKIRQIEKMPDGDSIIVIWVKLLCVAGRVNDGGQIYFTREIPYTEEMLATEFNRPLNTVRMALQIFQRFGMVEVTDDIYRISSWAEWQNVDGLEKLRDQNRKRVAAYRERKRLEAAEDVTLRNITSNEGVTQSNDIDIDKDIDIEVDKEIDKEKEKGVNKDKSILCSEPAEPPAELYADVEPIILNTGQEWRPTVEEYERYKRLYPAVDIMQAFRDMSGWCDANKSKRKTAAGVKRFVNSWLSRDQDSASRRGYTGPAQQNQGGKPDPFKQAWEEMHKEAQQ